jgi:hypothetical protein
VTPGRPGRPAGAAPGLVMDYYDGNTVTALWNYAPNYAMSDNNYGLNAPVRLGTAQDRCGYGPRLPLR